MLVLEGLVGIIERFNFSFFSVTGWGIDLDYCDIEWFALETNWDHSVIFKIAAKYCISDTFPDHEGYSISSKGFLPTIVDIKVIWVRFTLFHPFQLSDSLNPVCTVVISCLNTHTFLLVFRSLDKVEEHGQFGLRPNNREGTQPYPSTENWIKI